MATIRNDRDKLLQSTTDRVEHIVILTLSNNYVILAADAEGIIIQPNKADIIASVFVDGFDDTSNWTITAVGTGCSVTYSGANVYFTDFSLLNLEDSCSYVVTAERLGYTTKTSTVQIVRARSGAAAFTLNLSQELITLVAPGENSVPSFAGLVVDATVTSADIDVTNDWTFTKVDSKLTSTLVDNQITINGYDGTLYNTDYNNVCLQCHFDTDFSDSSRLKLTPMSTAPSDKVFISSTHSAVGSPGSLRLVNTGTWGDNIGGVALYFQKVPNFFLLGSYSIKLRIRIVSYSNWYTSSILEMYGTPFLQISGTADSLGPGGIGAALCGFPKILGNTQFKKVLALNTWYAIEISKNASDNKQRLFVDGELIAEDVSRTGNWTSSGLQNSILYTTSRLDYLIMYWGNPGTIAATNCYIDELQVSTGGVYNSADYTPQTYAFSDSGLIDSGYIDVTATRTGLTPISLTKRILVNTIRGKAIVTTSSLSSTALTVRGTYAGVPYDFTQANTTVSILVDGVEDSQNWTYFVNMGTTTGVYTLSMTGSVLTFSGITNNTTTTDNGAIVARRNGYPAQYLPFTITKIKDMAIPSGTTSNANVLVNCNYLGTVLDYVGATGIFTVKVNGVIDTNYVPTTSSATGGLTATYAWNGTAYFFTITAITADTGYVDVLLTHSGGIYTPVTVRINVSKFKAPKPAIIPSLSTSILIIESDTTGYVPTASYTGKATTASILFGTVDDTSNWTFTPTLTGTFTVTQSSGNIFTVTNLPTGFTTGILTITATKAGETSIVMVCNVVKNRVLPPEGLVLNNNLGSLYDWSTTTADATLLFKTNGEIVLTDLGSVTKSWINPITASIGDSYYVTVSVEGFTGSSSGITVDTAYLLTSDRSFTVSITPDNTLTGVIRYTIRTIVTSAPGPVVASGFVNLYLQAVTGS